MNDVTALGNGYLTDKICDFNQYLRTLTLFSSSPKPLNLKV